MDTIIIKTSIDNCKIELHFNLWNSEKNNKKYLDIGLMCNIEKKDYEIVLSIPGKYKFEQITDLAKILIEKNNICNNVFNCNMNITPRGLFATAEKKETEEKFLIQQFVPRVLDDGKKGAKANIEILDDKVNIIIPVKSEKEYIDYTKKYFRIRLTDFNLEMFLLEKTLKSKVFESSYEKISLIDFRINDIKLLPQDTAQLIKNNNLAINKVHFLYITDFDKNIVFTSPSMKIRIFEKNSWTEYIDMNKTEMVAYHMSIKEQLDTPSFSLKLQSNKSSLLHLLIYALGVIVLAIIANLITSLLGF